MANSIEINYNKSVDVLRLVDIENGTSEYETNLENLPAHIQPLEEGLSEDIDGNFGKDFLMFCDVVDIKEGDRVVDGATQYHVTAVDAYDFLGLPRHSEVKLRVSNL